MSPDLFHGTRVPGFFAFPKYSTTLGVLVVSPRPPPATTARLNATASAKATVLENALARHSSPSENDGGSSESSSPVAGFARRRGPRSIGR